MGNTHSKFALAMFALVLVSFVGCDQGNPFGLVPVSGTVTIDGQPAANIVLVFTPVANDSTSIVGPFSSAVTDVEGKFALKSKQGNPGAVIGNHTVSIQYRSFNPEAIDNLTQQIQEARISGGDVAAAKAALKQAREQRSIPERYSRIALTVGKSGLSDHKFELTSGTLPQEKP